LNQSYDGKAGVISNLNLKTQNNNISALQLMKTDISQPMTMPPASMKQTSSTKLKNIYANPLLTASEAQANYQKKLIMKN
jgi:hypothetical protein